MPSLLDRVLFGPREQLKKSDIEKLAERIPFSKYLNYNAHDDTRDIYVNQDQSIGLLWECFPAAFIGEKTLTSLKGLFRCGLPDGSILQVILFADTHISEHLNAYRQGITSEAEVFMETANRISGFMEEGREGLSACADIPVRNFRVFVAVKLPKDAPNIPKPEEFEKKGKLAYVENIQRQIAETLKGAGLWPRPLPPGELMVWFRRLFNVYTKDRPERNMDHYDHLRPLRMQMINAETVIRDSQDHLQIGDKYFLVATPKTMPKQVDPLQTNSLFGGIWGLSTDMDQIKSGFLYTLNILIDDRVNTQIRAKTTFLLNQRGFGTLSTKLQRKKDEFMNAVNDLEHGVKYVRIIPDLLLWGNTPEKAHDSYSRAVRLWEQQGYTMQQEKILRKVMFLSALPFGCQLMGRNLDIMNRDFIAPVRCVLPLLPIQGDFAGTGTPRLLFVGRKGQLIPIDFYEKGTINFNVYCAAETGSGKSFLINYIIFNYLANGAFVRLIDLGGSYQKICGILGGKYLDFNKDTKVCLNQFTHIIEPEAELASVVAVFAMMAKANAPKEECTAREWDLITSAVKWAWQQKGQEADADTVYEFLKRFPDLPGTEFPELVKDHRDLTATAKDLGLNIMKFTSHGDFGKFFTGPSTLDIHQDPFVVLELEQLKAIPALYRVVTLLVINSVTQDLYLSDRSRRKLVIFEEAWQFIGEGAMLKQVVEEGYRRARKYNGSFMVVTQRILDMESFGDVGGVINTNSAYKMYLASKDVEQAKRKALIDYGDFELRILKGVKSNPPYFSEIFFDTPFGCGVARLVVDSYSYFTFTSKADERAAIDKMVNEEGMSYHEAILEMMRRQEQ
jgi:conjugal transfer ATP-binding protein TraC